MSKDLKIQVLLSAVDKMTIPLQNIKRQMEKLQAKTKGTAEALNKLKQQDKTAEAFKKMQNAVSQSNQKLVEAREKAQRLAEQLRNTAQPTAAFRKKVADAHKAVHRMSQSQEEQRRKLNALRQALKEGGFNTAKFRESQEKLKQKIKQATSEIEKQNVAMKKLQQRQARNQAYRQSVEKVKSYSDRLRNFGQASMVAGTTGSAITGIMLKPAVEFEQDFSKVQALTGLNKANPEQAEKLERLRQQGIDLGATTSFTSGEVAQGQGYLAMAGFNADQIEKSMPAVLAMTKAAGIEMGRVADISSDISSGFKIPADEMGRVADVLTATFSGSNTTLEGLGETMKYLGPIATATGQDFETMSAMVGLLGNVGIKGSQAGTSLRAAMLRLAGPPKQAAKAMKALGVSAKDSKGNMRAITDILVDVEKKTAKMGTAQKMAYYKAIFGAEAATAMVELVAQAGVNGIQEMTEKLKGSAGRAEEVARVMSDNFLGDIKALESAREAIGISIYDTIDKHLRGIVQSFTEVLRNVNEWIKTNPELTAKIVKWGAAVTVAVTVLGGLSMLLSFLFYPMARLVLAIGHFSGATTLLNLAFTKIKTNAVSLNRAWLSHTKTLDLIKIAYSKTLDLIKIAYSKVASVFRMMPAYFVALSSKLMALFSQMKSLGFWVNMLKRLFSFAFSPIRMLLMGIGGAISFLLSPIGLLATALVGASVWIYTHWEQVKRFFSGFWEGLKSGLAPVIEKFKPLGDAFGVVVGWIKQAVKWVMDLISPVQTTTIELLAASKAGRNFGEWLAAGIDLVTKPLQWLVDTIKWVIDNMPSLSSVANSIVPKEQAEQISRTANMAAMSGFSSGGYTGNGGKYQPKGIVHGGEYVMTKETTSRLGVGLLDRLNYGSKLGATALMGASVAMAQPIKIDTRPPLTAHQAVGFSQPSASPVINITLNTQAGQNEQAIAQQIARAVSQALQKERYANQAKARGSLYDKG